MNYLKCAKRELNTKLTEVVYKYQTETSYKYLKRTVTRIIRAVVTDRPKTVGK